MSQHASPRISVHGDGISTFAGVTDNTLSYYFDRSSATSGFSTADSQYFFSRQTFNRCICFSFVCSSLDVYA